jgi:hypothetical protein
LGTLPGGAASAGVFEIRIAPWPLPDWSMENSPGAVAPIGRACDTLPPAAVSVKVAVPGCVSKGIIRFTCPGET